MLIGCDFFFSLGFRRRKSGCEDHIEGGTRRRRVPRPGCKKKWVRAALKSYEDDCWRGSWGAIENQRVTHHVVRRMANPSLCSKSRILFVERRNSNQTEIP